MSRPLVSVITPTYRRPHYLLEALASVINQTYSNLQIIVRDNASGDETPEVVASFNDSRILFLQAEHTGTADDNATACTKHIRGDYFIPLCDDDRLGLNYIEVLLAELEGDKSILAGYGATTVIDQFGEIIGKVKPDGRQLWQAPDLIRAWCAGTIPLATGINFLCPAWFLFDGLDRRRFANGHNTDNALFLTAGIQGKVLFTDRCTFYYRHHATNTEKLSTFEDHFTGDKQFLSYLDAEVYSERNVGVALYEWPNLRDKLQAMLAGNYYRLFRIYCRHRGNLRKALRGMLLDPIGVYGFRNCLKCLWRELRLSNRAAWTKWPRRARNCFTRWLAEAQFR